MMPGPGTPEPPPADARQGRGTPPQGNGPAGGSTGGSGSAGGSTTKHETEKKVSDLQFNKVVAGAGAAIVTAVLGSFLGAVGTILGAALGSIITTVATTFFQKSIDVTRAQVTDKGQKLRERTQQRGSNRAQGAAAWQAAAAAGMPSPDAQETTRIDPAEIAAAGATRPPGRLSRFRKLSRKQVLVSALGALLAFGLAMFLITGIEWVKGSTITGGNSGTSIGNVANNSATQQQKNDDTSGSGTSTSESTTTTDESGSNSTGESSSTSENDEGGSSSPSSSNPLGGLNKLVPTQGNEPGQQQSGSGNSGNSGGGADSSN